MASIWRDPIFDRTYSDVTFAIQQIAYWKESHRHATDIVLEHDKVVINEGEGDITDEVAVLETDGAVFVENETLVAHLGTVYDLKGCLNLSDLTRIEDNVTYLATRLAQYRYSIGVTTKEWDEQGLPTSRDMERIGKNICSIISVFATFSELSSIPNEILSYDDINILERNLYLLKQLLDAMEGSFIEAGTYRSGSTSRLPIRR